MITEDLENVLNQLKSDDSVVRSNALDTLGIIKPENALEIILPFLKDPVADVRGTAAFSLGLIRDPRAIPHLIAFLEEESDERERCHGFVALENYQDLAILQYLLNEVERPKLSRRPRQHIAELLRNFDTDASILALIKLFQEDEDIDVKDNAVESLLVLNQISLQPFWEETLMHRYPHFRKIAKKALAQIKKLDKRRSETNLK